ncbi:MAG: gamma-glutamyltransferase [Oligoflexus sp.]|nr:gamma-glutamyltransferase [Pseudopedobacter sp.]
MKTNLILLLAILLFGVKAFSQTQYYKNGAVVSGHPEASKIGVDILKQGGNAIDAAVAVQFALAVVYPNAGNIGGGGFMVYRSSKGKKLTLDFREKAPKLAARDMYLDSLGSVVKEKSLYGHLAAGIPGSVDGMAMAHKRLGKLNWKLLLQPAINLANNGFKITAKQAEELNYYAPFFKKYTQGPSAFTSKSFWKTGDTLVQKDLANTLMEIQKYGRKGFYKGWVAKCLVAEMNRGKGIITLNDLRDYHSVWRKPLTNSYKDYQITSMPPPSSGGIALLQLLQSVAPYPISHWGARRDSTIQLMVEAERRVYADRATHLGDPDFVAVPQKALLDTSYQKSRMANMSWTKASPSTQIMAGEIVAKESEETTHFSIVDKDKNAVSITTTLNGSYGSFVAVENAGFLLNNEMDDFSVKPGSPNLYGLIGGEANAIAPNKRMLSSMTPTIVEKNGKLFMVLGTPGGSTIITSVFQVFLNVVEFNMNMQEAVNATRFHHQWLPDIIYSEKGAFDEATTNSLLKKGYKIELRGTMGRVDAILQLKEGLETGADKRGDDKAEGY